MAHPASALPALLLPAALIGLGACRSPAPERPRPTALAAVDSTHHEDALAREPMVVEHPDGTIFVAGYGDPGPKLWKSADGGRTWSRVFVGTEAEGAVGNSDVDLAVGPDGTVYFVTMGFDRQKLEGTHVAVGVSHDVGATWTWTRLSTTRLDDRPWIAVAPDGLAHVIWNDGAGVSHAVSRDGGRTWTERDRIHNLGGSSHLAVGPAGEVAVRIVPLAGSGNRIDREVDLIAVSADGGATWAKHPPPGAREWGFPIGNPADLPRWVEPIAWDDTGALFYLWSEGTTLVLGRSRDRGATWTTWPVASGGKRLYFPYLIGRGSGELVGSWVAGDGDSLEVRVAWIDASGDGPPSVLEARPVVPASYGFFPGTQDRRDPAGEYLATAFLRSGDIALVTPIQHFPAGRMGFSWWRFALRP